MLKEPQCQSVDLSTKLLIVSNTLVMSHLLLKQILVLFLNVQNVMIIITLILVKRLAKLQTLNLQISVMLVSLENIVIKTALFTYPQKTDANIVCLVLIKIQLLKNVCLVPKALSVVHNIKKDQNVLNVMIPLI